MTIRAPGAALSGPRTTTWSPFFDPDGPLSDAIIEVARAARLDAEEVLHRVLERVTVHWRLLRFGAARLERRDYLAHLGLELGLGLLDAFVISTSSRLRRASAEVSTSSGRLFSI